MKASHVYTVWFIVNVSFEQSGQGWDEGAEWYLWEDVFFEELWDRGHSAGM